MECEWSNLHVNKADLDVNVVYSRSECIKCK